MWNFYNVESFVLLLQGLLIMMMMFSCHKETYDWTWGYGFSLIVIMFHLVIGEPEPEDRKFEKF